MLESSMHASDMAISKRIDAPYRRRIAVLLEPGRRGAAALAHAAGLCESTDSELTVVALAPTAGTVCRSCGGVSTRAYNCAVRDDVAAELHRAVASLSTVAPQLESALLVEGTDPPLQRWVVQNGFDLVLLPSRWGVRRFERHPAARVLRRHTDASVRVVG
jgi:hypothetical protein